MSMFRLAWIDNPPSLTKVPDGKSNTEDRLREVLVDKFQESKVVFVLIRHQASKSMTYAQVADGKPYKRPAGNLFRITATVYITRDNKYNGQVQEAKGVHLWVPDKHAKEIANEQEMNKYRQQCVDENPEDTGPPDNPELIDVTDDAVKEVLRKLAKRIEDRIVPAEFFM